MIITIDNGFNFPNLKNQIFRSPDTILLKYEIFSKIMLHITVVSEYDFKRYIIM